MEQLRFDGQVAIVTGAGGNPGLGRSKAMLLAERGARVVVNDLGVGPDGKGGRPAKAELVVEEIRAAGGEAVADTNSVAERESAEAIVQTALDTWGRVDILVSNAGIMRVGLFDEITPDDVEAIVAAHFMGNLWMSRAVWPHMKQAGYGRIILISSGTTLGIPRTVTYAAAKAGVMGLARGLAAEGADLGIKVNSLAPTAMTVAFQYLSPDAKRAHLIKDFAPEQVAPAILVLSHESCPTSGAVFRAGGGSVAEWFQSKAGGYTNSEMTPEDVLENWDDVVDRSKAEELPDPLTLAAEDEIGPASTESART